jgi:NAD(P)-dependent dehydrogenase (short-subunit alcohol dehydrogenase family)
MARFDSGNAIIETISEHDSILQRERILGAMGKTALITGVTGQDGAYLAKLLLNKGYTVYGFVARRATESTWRLREIGIEHDIALLQGDLTDMASLCSAIDTAFRTKSTTSRPKVSSEARGRSRRLPPR